MSSTYNRAGGSKEKKKINKNKTIVPYVPSRIGDAESLLMLDSW
jgi:hypothetical protein